MFEEWKPNDYISLRRNPHYWRRGVPNWERLVVKIIPEDATRVAFLLGGAAGPALIGFLFDVSGSYAVPLVTSAMLLVGAGLLALRIPSARAGPDPHPPGDSSS